MSGIFNINAWQKIWAYRDTFLLGLANTAKTALFGLMLSFVLGVIFGLMSTSGKKPLKVISRIYVEVIQNTPLLLQLCFLYYCLFTLMIQYLFDILN